MYCVVPDDSESGKRNEHLHIVYFSLKSAKITQFADRHICVKMTNGFENVRL